MLIEENKNLDADNPDQNMSLKEKFQTKSVTKELTGHKKRVYTLDWNVNGSKLASGSVDYTIKVKRILKI
jgi:WD40 repeat protein